MGNLNRYLTRAVRDRRIVGETHLSPLLEHDGRCLPASDSAWPMRASPPGIGSTSCSR
jgi:hypothetical protein